MEHKKSWFKWDFWHQWMRLYKRMLMRPDLVKHSRGSLIFPSCVSWSPSPFIMLLYLWHPFLNHRPYVIMLCFCLSVLPSNSWINVKQIWKRTSDNWGPVNFWGYTLTKHHLLKIITRFLSWHQSTVVCVTSWCPCLLAVMTLNHPYLPFLLAASQQ